MFYKKTKQEIIEFILQNKNVDISADKTGFAFAPSNIALCKYWGKRDLELNLPQTSSLSISLGDYGATTNIKLDSSLRGNDIVYLNNKVVSYDSDFYRRLTKFLDLFRFNQNYFYEIHTEINIPVASGLASSACGFAALVLALNDLFDWDLDNKSLSILARLGSGSAARSIYQGLVIWHAGERQDGMDSFAEKLDYDWPELKIGLLIIDDSKKYLSSREAMLHTVNTSKLYNSWNIQVEQDLELIKLAIKNKDFNLLGATAENNALAMHACMLAAKPAILYSKPQTIELMQKIWQLRADGLNVYFTQDAGPNLKLIYHQDDEVKVKKIFKLI